MSQLNKLISARGGKAPETDEEWAAYQEQKAARRAKNVADAREVLDKNGIKYVERSKFPQVEFHVSAGRHSIRYWPEIGKWYTYEGEERFGVKNLVRHIKGYAK